MADVEVIIDNTGLALSQMEAGIERALEVMGGECEKDAKMICPKDTGRLQNSITHTTDKGSKTVTIGTNVEYAIYVHEGHGLPNGKSVAPRRFLKNALMNNAQKYRQMAEVALKGFLQ